MSHCARRVSNRGSASTAFRLYQVVGRAALIAVSAAILAVPVRADWKDEVGFTQLKAELGASMPTGLGIGISQVEARSPAGDYVPVTTNAEFVGKTFIPMSGASSGSGHASWVGYYFYGLTMSLAPAITQINSWETNHWVNSGFLKSSTTSEPVVETRAIQNHSWIGGTTPGQDQDILRRFDYTIDRDNYVAVVGLNNGSTTTLPHLLAHNYNGISVGLTNGNHSTGTTTFDAAGRVKPDIVAPLGATSYATPAVGSAAALLRQTANDNSSWVNARNSETLKALLLAGATKDEFVDWDRTTTRPLDEHYGAGELNVRRSYYTLAAGEYNPSVTSVVSPRGWDFGQSAFHPSIGLFYFFDVPAGSIMTELSAALTWNRQIADTVAGSGWGNPSASLANLDMRLYSASQFTTISLLDSSLSTVDNVEHIYRRALTPGRYALEIRSDTANRDYALAWYGNVVPDLWWDANPGAPGAQGGNGTWVTSEATWWDGTTNVASNTGQAIFTGNPGNVAVGTVTASTMRFDTAGYVLNGGSIDLTGGLIVVSQNTTVNSALKMGAGFTKTGTGALTLSGKGTQNVGAKLTIAAGAINADATINNPLGAGLAVEVGTGASLFITAGSAEAKSIRGNGGAVSVANGATLKLSPGSTVNHVVGSLNLNSTGTLDLTNGALIVDYVGSTPFGTLRQKLKNGVNLDNGLWNGTGIISSSAASEGGSKAIGMIEASDLALLGITSYADPQGGSDPLDGTAIVLKYTYWGDANLDGDNDVDDFIFWSSGFPSSSGATWFTGDFDYDGDNDIDDFIFWSSTFPTIGPLLGDDGISAQSQLVPEPRTLSLIGAAALLLIVGRWSRRKPI